MSPALFDNGIGALAHLRHDPIARLAPRLAPWDAWPERHLHHRISERRSTIEVPRHIA
jgi:hypothetical protein